MSNEINIIKIDGNISKPATVLIEKIASAIGIVYGPIDTVRKAKAEAEAELIKLFAGIENSELGRRTIARLVQEEIKKQENIEAIIAQTIDKLNEQAKSEEMDNDWIAHFFDKCRNVSDKEMQGLWSDILSGEANAPGTYSKRTLELVSSLDKKEADMFTVLCSFAILDGCNILYPLILNVEDEIYSKVGLNFWWLTQLEVIGLITLITTGFGVQDRPKSTIFGYYETDVKFKFKKDSDNTIYMGQVMLTESGKQLASICGSEINPEFIGYAMEHYNNKENKVGDVVSMTIVE